MFTSFSISRLTATQRSSLQQGFPFVSNLAQRTPAASGVRELTVLAHSRSASGSAGRR